MGGCGIIYLRFILLLLLSAVPNAYAIKGLWKVDIDNGPAPPSESGPPLSAHATRNRSDLPYEIVGIVAAYIGFTLIMGTVYLTVGRKLRKRAQDIASGVRQVKIPEETKSASPVSYSPSTRQSSWKSSGKKNGVVTKVRSMDSTDLESEDHQRAHRAHREKMNNDMERAYGAVFDNEDNIARRSQRLPQSHSPAQEHAYRNNYPGSRTSRTTTHEYPYHGYGDNIPFARDYQQQCPQSPSTPGYPSTPSSTQFMQDQGIPLDPYPRSVPSYTPDPRVEPYASETISPISTRQTSSVWQPSRSNTNDTATNASVRRHNQPLPLRNDSQIQESVRYLRSHKSEESNNKSEGSNVPQTPFTLKGERDLEPLYGERKAKETKSPEENALYLKDLLFTPKTPAQMKSFFRHEYAGAVMEDDAVPDDEDLWRSGY